METWQGSVVEESLTDNRVINEIKVLKVAITGEALTDLRWHVYSVSVSEKEIALLSIFIKQKWYMHFWTGDKMKIIFKGKSFDVARLDKNSWKDAINYGLSLGIPAEQLDFVTD